MPDNIQVESMPDKDARLWGMLCHLSAFAGFIVPFGNLIAPLVIWVIKKNDMPFVDDQGKESINFQISVLIAAVVCVVLMLIGIGFLLLFALAIYAVVMVIIASIKANDGVAYRYPYSLRLIS